MSSAAVFVWRFKGYIFWAVLIRPPLCLRKKVGIDTQEQQPLNIFSSMFIVTVFHILIQGISKTIKWIGRFLQELDGL